MQVPRTISRKPITLVTCLAVALSLAPSIGMAQVRTKKPDRQVYQPPRLATNGGATNGGATNDRKSDAAKTELADLLRSGTPLSDSNRDDGRSPKSSPATDTAAKRELVEVTLTEATDEIEPPEAVEPKIVNTAAKLKRVAHEEIILVEPDRAGAAGYPAATRESEIHNPAEFWPADIGVPHDGTCDGCPDCDSLGCDAIGCDSMGCDSTGICGSSWLHGWSNSSLRLSSDCWFGSAEVMLMFRKGDLLPPLVTTGPDTDPDTAGELGPVVGTQVLAGGNTVLKDMTAGGRFTLGTWIDNQQCRSLVLRGWFAGEETYRYHADQDQVPVLARPFLNVSDNQAAAQDTQLIAFPNRASGSISVNASSDVFGGDLQIRQFWYGKYGATVDLLYGYQYMRLNEDLSISNTSTSLNDDFAPLGSVISVADQFGVENEFHGGQLGMASHYREGCWSFNGLLKVGFGSLRRNANLSGSTLTSIDGVNATDPNGLLVRSTNSGSFTDSTFGWVPELDMSLGWHQYPRFDVTVGYHLVAMTDALQVSNTIDPALAVNLSSPPTGQQRPTLAMRYNTFYLQGIHFGLQYVY